MAVFHEEIHSGAESDSDIDSYDFGDMLEHALCVEFRVLLNQRAGDQCCSFVLDVDLDTLSEDD